MASIAFPIPEPAAAGTLMLTFHEGVDQEAIMKRINGLKVTSTNYLGGVGIGTVEVSDLAVFQAFLKIFDGVASVERDAEVSIAEPAAAVESAPEANDGLASALDDCKTPLTVQDYLMDIAPPLDGRSYKGQAGRIGVLGGSIDFAGAPYYAGMAALRVGAELLYLCTAWEATGPIKGYSPELMVSEVYRWSQISSENSADSLAEQDRMVEKMTGLLPRFHALAIGPGLGRDDRVLTAVARVIDECRARQLPLVIDADGLWLIERRPDLLKGYREAVITPNAAEFRRLAKALLGDEKAQPAAVCEELAGPVLLQKGRVDRIFAPGAEPLECAEEGAPRRPGGLGDFLAGSLAVFLGWSAAKRRDQLMACKAACTLVRRACRSAFIKKKRAMVAPDVLEEVADIFEEMCPAVRAKF